MIKLLLTIGIIFLIGCAQPLAIECQTDADCVPADCCHPDSCVPLAEKPDCAAVICSASCEPGTLDCGQASCSCINNKCGVRINE